MARTIPLKTNVAEYLKITGLSAVSPSASAFDASADIVRVALSDGDGQEALTFAQAAANYTPKAFEVTATYSGTTLSLWHLLDLNPGATVSLVWGPHGNSVPAADKPTVSATVTLGARPNLETEADAAGNDV